MNILERRLQDWALFYVNQLIIKPLVPYGHLQLDEFDIKQLEDIVQDALIKTKSTQNLGSSLGHYTNNWNIDWDWIAHHIIMDYHNITLAHSLIDGFGGDRKVYKQIENSDSPKSCHLYLTDGANRNSEPKTFLLSELVANGSNLDRNEEQWKPVIGVTDFGFRKCHPYGNPEFEEVEHYYDNAYLFSKSEFDVWDEKNRAYKFEEKPLTEMQKKVRSLIKITTTDENGNVISLNKYYSPPTKTKQKSASETKEKRWWEKLF